MSQHTAVRSGLGVGSSLVSCLISRTFRSEGQIAYRKQRDRANLSVVLLSAELRPYRNVERGYDEPAAPSSGTEKTSPGEEGL